MTTQTLIQIEQYLLKGYGVEVWEAFYNPESTSADTLRELGCRVVCEHVDVFTHKLGTRVVSNPPFSCEEEV